MPLELEKLENLRAIGGGRNRARCPACAADGGDKAGVHLLIEPDGRFGCAARPGDGDHRRQIAAFAGRCRVETPNVSLGRPLPTPAPQRSLEMPPLRFPTVGELAQLATARGLPTFAGLELAARAGMLHTSTLADCGEPVAAWVLVDSSRRCAQARRLDGKPWRDIEAKAKTLRGSQAAWPIGAADIGSKPFVAFCEGGPDTLAAWTLAWWHGMTPSVGPVCMPGSHQIHSDALPLFVGKGVWVFPHKDAAGERALQTWTAQLLSAGALWVKPFDVAPFKDLNEWLTAAAAAEESAA